MPFNKSFAPGKKSFDFDINQISYTQERAKVVTFSKSYYDVNQAIVVLKGTKIASVHTIAGLRPFKLGAQVGTTSYSFITDTIKPTTQPAVYPQNASAVQALKNKQIAGLVVDLPTAFYVTAAQVPNSEVLGQFTSGGGAGYFGMVFAKGNPLAACVDKALAKLRTNGTLKQIQQKWLAKATGAPVLEVDEPRRSRILGARARGGDGRRGAAIALLSTVVFLVVAGFAITHAPGWHEVKQYFFDGRIFKSSFPEIARAFLLNCKIFSIAECFILVFALLLAVLREPPGAGLLPAAGPRDRVRRFLPRRADDPGDRDPRLRRARAADVNGIPTSTTFWGIVALVLVYSAYVSEVYRAGIESVHPSQEAAARSLGLTRGQTLRKVILPQAVRRVIPPLLNDFIGLQKDTALVGTLGAIEAFKQASIDTNATFNYTPYLAAALLFVAITIPLARFTDWLIARDRRRRQAQGMYA